MNRKRLLVHLVTVSSAILLIIIASGIGLNAYANANAKARKLSTNPNSENLPSSDDSGGKKEVIIWNRSSSSGQLEVEERFQVEDLNPKSETISSTSQSTTTRRYFQKPLSLPSTTKQSTLISTSTSTSPRTLLPEPRSYNSETRSEVKESTSRPSTHRLFSPNRNRSSSLFFPRGGAKAEPAGEVRSVPVFIQSRPVYSKPSPKPKLLLKPPHQLLKDAHKSPSSTGDEEPALPDVERVTQTVYGFLDFVTTIGNTVMVFTPQTKKVFPDLVKPTATSEFLAATVKPTEKPKLTPEPISKEENNLVASVSSSSSSSSSFSPRQPKLMVFPEEPSPVVIEASEVEPQVYGSSVVQVAPPLDDANFVPEERTKKEQNKKDFSIVPSAPEVLIRTQVNVVASSPNLGSGEFIEGEVLPEEAQPQPQASRPQVTTAAPSIQSKSKGFTLKLTPKHNAPVIITPAYSVPVVVTAQKVNLPPPPPPNSKKDEPTGVLNQIYETRVNDGRTTVVETKIIGTHIGTQYARILESSSSVLPKIEATKAVTLTSSASPAPSVTIIAQKVPTTKAPVVVPVAAPSTVNAKHAEPNENDHEFEHDDRLNEDLPDEHEGEVEDDQDDQNVPHSSSSLVIIEPTPTASEEQTHYILPQKEQNKPEKIYVSPVPNPNAYSRQPQLYVDINPAKSSVDVIVTATPSRGKQFRLSNRFSNRLNKNQAAAADSNELTQVQDVPQSTDDTSSSNGRRSRFGRNRARSGNGRQNEDVVPTVSVYSHIVSATPSRRFKSGGRTSSSSRSKEVTFKTAQAARGYNPSTRQVQVAPTSSSSIYRFKLNRPTGRWRFKPSPKPKVNIIKTKEDEELEAPVEQKFERDASNGPVYLQNLEASELQHPEETRTESNELVHDIEPELVPQTIRVATITPTDFSDLDKYLEIATIKSPYVFQAGNVKNTRYITVTKTFTKENIQPTLASSVSEATLENILGTKPPYEKILEGSSDVATLPVIVLGSDMATPPLETITQSFSTTQLMLKTSILPVLYDGVTTLYTLTQSYFITRLVTAHKTVPPVELFQFVPTKSLNEFNTALQEAGSEHREHLLGSESDDENDTNYEHILAPPDELTSVGSDFDPSSMDEKIPKPSGEARPSKELVPRGKSVDSPPNPFSPPGLSNSIADPLNGLSGLTSEQLAFIRYFTSQNQQQQQQNQQQQQFQQSQQLQPQSFLPQTPPIPSNNLFPQFPQVPQGNPLGQNQYSVTSSPVVVDTVVTVTETKTLRILFGAKPTFTTLYSTRVVPTRMTTYVTASVPVRPSANIQNPFLNALPFPLAYVG